MKKLVIVMIAVTTILVASCGLFEKKESTVVSADSTAVVVDTVTVVCADSVAVDSVK